MMHLSRQVVTKRLKVDGTNWVLAAGTSAANSDVIDTAGADGVRFIMGFGAIVSGAVTSIKVQQGSDATVTDAADLAGSSITVADTDDNKIVISDYIRPGDRYMRVVTSRATQNATVDFLIAELYYQRTTAVTQDTTVATLEVFSTPAEGTA